MDVLKQLSAPFDDKDIEWRVMMMGVTGKGRPWAMLAPYIDSRAIMNRLDSVVGMHGWTDEYREIQTPNGAGIICRLSLFVKGEKISKEDGCDFGRDIEPTKSGISDALKRAAVKFGIGRYLYDLPTFWAENIQEGRPPENYPKRIVKLVKKGVFTGFCDAPENHVGYLPAGYKFGAEQSYSDTISG